MTVKKAKPEIPAKPKPEASKVKLLPWVKIADGKFLFKTKQRHYHFEYSDVMLLFDAVFGVQFGYYRHDTIIKQGFFYSFQGSKLLNVTHYIIPVAPEPVAPVKQKTTGSADSKVTV